MTDKIFVDSNILVYAHDALAGERHEMARSLVRELWRNRSGVVSTQVIQETYVNLRKKAQQPLSAREARDTVEDYLSWELVVNDGTSILAAMEIERRYQLSFWDALIVQAAERAGAPILLTEDLNHGQRYTTTTAQNPFAALGSESSTQRGKAPELSSEL